MPQPTRSSTYQTAYLKANYPVEFLAALMTLDLGNTDKLNVFRQELNRLGIRLLPPDINRSEVTFAVETDPKTGKPAIRYALAAVKGVGAQAMAELVAERDARGRFKDLADFSRRLDAKSFNRRQFESLAKAGAFDSLNPNRAQTFAAAELLLRQASLAAEERESRQESLFAGIDPSFAPRPSLPLVADWPPVERLQHEFAAIGFYLSSHPLDPYGKSLERAGIIRWADLPAGLAANPTNRFRLAGIVIGRKERTSGRGNRFAFVQMSDPSGTFEVTLFSEILRAGARPARFRSAAGRHGRCAQRRGKPAADRAEDRAARHRRRPRRGGAARLCRRGPRPLQPQKRHRPRSRRPRPRHRRPRPPRPRSRNRHPRRLQGRPRKPAPPSNPSPASSTCTIFDALERKANDAGTQATCLLR